MRSVTHSPAQRRGLAESREGRRERRRIARRHDETGDSVDHAVDSARRVGGYGRDPCRCSLEDDVWKALAVAGQGERVGDGQDVAYVIAPAQAVWRSPSLAKPSRARTSSMSPSVTNRAVASSGLLSASANSYAPLSGRRRPMKVTTYSSSPIPKDRRPFVRSTAADFSAIPFTSTPLLSRPWQGRSGPVRTLAAAR